MKKLITMTPQLKADLEEFNSSLGEHYTVVAQNVLALKKTHRLSERDIASLTVLSKSQIHRLLQIARYPRFLSIAAKANDTDMYVLLLLHKHYTKEFYYQVLDGHIKTYAQARKYLKVSR